MKNVKFTRILSLTIAILLKVSIFVSWSQARHALKDLTVNDKDRNDIWIGSRKATVRDDFFMIIQEDE